MPLNASGQISMGGSTVGESINLELNQSATATITLNDNNVRTLAGISSGAIDLNTFKGKSNIPNYFVLSANTATVAQANTLSNPYARVASSGNMYLYQHMPFGSFRSSQGTGNNKNFVTKVNSSGDQVWTVDLGWKQLYYSSKWQAVNEDSSGNVYVSSGGSASDGGGVNAFVQKFDSSGSSVFNTQYSWTSSAGGTTHHFQFRTVVDSAGNSYMVSRKSLVANELQVVKINSSGTVVWAKRLTINTVTSAFYDNYFDIDTDSSGNVYILSSGSASGAQTQIHVTKLSGSDGSVLACMRLLHPTNNTMLVGQADGQGFFVSSTGHIYFTVQNGILAYGPAWFCLNPDMTTFAYTPQSITAAGTGTWGYDQLMLARGPSGGVIVRFIKNSASVGVKYPFETWLSFDTSGTLLSQRTFDRTSRIGGGVALNVFADGDKSIVISGPTGLDNYHPSAAFKVPNDLSLIKTGGYPVYGGSNHGNFQVMFGDSSNAYSGGSALYGAVSTIYGNTYTISTSTATATTISVTTASALTISGATVTPAVTTNFPLTNKFTVSSTPATSNSQIWAIPGSYSWSPPSGVTSISLVAIAGGGGGWWCASGTGGALAWLNNKAVSSSNTHNLWVGSGSAGVQNGQVEAGASYMSQNGTGFIYAGNGGSFNYYNNGAGSYNGFVGGGGGGGRAVSGPYCSGRSGGNAAGGYGTSGYNGIGGRATTTPYTNGTKGVCGGGAGAAGYYVSYQGGAAGGGGTGLLGRIHDGSGCNPFYYPTGGSGGGSSGPFNIYPRNGGTFGGGGGAGGYYNTINPSSYCPENGRYCYQFVANLGGNGGGGGVRIIWPGCARSFPNTNVGTL